MLKHYYCKEIFKSCEGNCHILCVYENDQEERVCNMINNL